VVGEQAAEQAQHEHKKAKTDETDAHPQEGVLQVL
jgi:hypothetical protein